MATRVAYTEYVRPLNTLIGHKSKLRALLPLPYGILASSSEDGTIKVWNTKRGKCLFDLKGHTGAVSSLAYLEEQKCLVSGSCDGTVKIWSIFTVKPACVRTIHATQMPRLQESAVPRPFEFPAIAVLSERLARVVGEHIQIYRTDTWEHIRTLSHNENVTGITVSEDGRLICASHGRCISVWKCSNGVCQKTLIGHSKSVWSLCVLPRNHLASGSFDGEIRIWNLDSGNAIKIVHEPDRGLHSVNSLTLLPERYLVSGCNGGKVRIWSEWNNPDVRSSCIVLPAAHNTRVESMAVLSDGILASTSGDKIWMWETSSMLSPAEDPALSTRVEPQIDEPLPDAETAQIQTPEPEWEQLIAKYDTFLPNILEWLKCALPGRYSVNQLLSMTTQQSEQAVLNVLLRVIEKVCASHSLLSKCCDLRYSSIFVCDTDQVVFRFFESGTGSPLHYGMDAFFLGMLLVQCLQEPPEDVVIAMAFNSGLPESGLLKGWLKELCERLLDNDRDNRPSMDEVYRLFLDNVICHQSREIESMPDLSVSVKRSLHTLTPPGDRPPLAFIFPSGESPATILEQLSAVQSIPDLSAEWSFMDASDSVEDTIVQYFMHNGHMDSCPLHPEWCTPSDSNEVAFNEMFCAGKLLAHCLLREIPLKWKLSPHVFDVLVGQDHDDPGYCLSIFPEAPVSAAHDTECLFHPLQRQEEIDQAESQLRISILGENCRLKNLEALKEGFYSAFDGTIRNQLSQLSGCELMLMICGEWD